MVPLLLPCVPDEPWIVALRPWQRNALAWFTVIFIALLYILLPAALAAAATLAWTGQPRLAGSPPDFVAWTYDSPVYLRQGTVGNPTLISSAARYIERFSF